MPPRSPTGTTSSPTGTASRISAHRTSQRPTPAPLRQCLSRFATGVTVVTFETGTGRHGVTVNAFSSISLDPPLIMVSIAKAARSHDKLRGQRFCVNILAAEQEPIARHFAGGPVAVPRWVDGPIAPRLAGTLAHLACTPWREYDGGDHTLFLGEVRDYAYRSGDALAYANSRFTTLSEPTLGHEHLL